MITIKHNGKEVQFGAIVGGIAWPGEKSGFGVVVGIERFPAVGTKTYHHYLLSETEDNDIDKLISSCSKLAEYYEITYFFGRRDDSSINYLSIWNQDAKKRDVSEFDVTSNQYSDNGLIGYNINVLKNRLCAENKTLHLLNESKLKGYLLDIPPNMVSTATDTQFPAIAALGYAVAALTEYESYDDENEMPPRREVGRSRVTGY